jgi:hypothetical protein
VAKLSKQLFFTTCYGHVITNEPYVAIKSCPHDYYDTFTLFSNEAILLYILVNTLLEMESDQVYQGRLTKYAII